MLPDDIALQGALSDSFWAAKRARLESEMAAQIAELEESAGARGSTTLQVSTLRLKILGGVSKNAAARPNDFLKTSISCVCSSCFREAVEWSSTVRS